MEIHSAIKRLRFIFCALAGLAAVDRILRYDDIEAGLASDPTSAPRPVVVSDKFPGEMHHGWIYLRLSAGTHARPLDR